MTAPLACAADAAPGLDCCRFRIARDGPRIRAHLPRKESRLRRGDAPNAPARSRCQAQCLRMGSIESHWVSNSGCGSHGGAAYGIDGVGTRDGVARILPQEDGFLGLELYRPPISWRVIRLPEGTFPVAEDVRLELLPDPTGGALVVELPRNYKQWWISALRLDGHGQLRTPPAELAHGAPAAQPKATGGGVSISCKALVVFTAVPFGR